jgi:hypothetical protein
MEHEIICIFWESVKPGLIPTYEPDGSSLHLNHNDKDAFIAEHQSEHLITSGEVHYGSIDDFDYDKLKKSKNGMWATDFYPPMGQKKDGHWEPVST